MHYEWLFIITVLSLAPVSPSKLAVRVLSVSFEGGTILLSLRSLLG